MSCYLYKLRFISPLQTSSDPLSLGISEPFIHSDTLFSAITNALATSFAFQFDKKYFADPPFTLSSAFPFLRDTLFLPKPPVYLREESKTNQPNKKKIKKAKFISKEIFTRVVRGEDTGELSSDHFTEEGFITDTPLKENICKVQEVPRCRINRKTSETEIFYSSRIRFNNEGGLYFLAKFEDDLFKKNFFDPALRILGDTGIGADRAIGLGQFKVCIEEFDIESIESPDKDQEFVLTISLFHPTKKEIESGILDDARYDLIERQNWIYSSGGLPLRSKTVRMFTEGSIFKSVPSIKGDIVDVTPSIANEYIPHRVYRNGLAFPLSISKNALEKGGTS